MITLDLIEKNQRGRIIAIDTDLLPLKLIEMGCLPGNIVELFQVAPFHDPIYLNINDSFVAIRKETASLILIDIINE